MRARVFLVVVFLTVLLVPSVAHAKGPDQATIDGAGMAAPISIDGTEGSDDDLGTLADVSGLWPATYAQRPDPMLAAAPTEGPGSEAGDHVEDPGRRTRPRRRSDRSSTCTRRAGPLTYTAPDQPLMGSERTTGGWFRTPSVLQPRWETFDLPTRATLEAGRSTRRQRRRHPRAPAAVVSRSCRGSSWSVRRSAPAP